MLLTNFIIILFNFAILTLQTFRESKNDSVHLHDDSDIIIRTSLNDYTDNETQSWHWKFDGDPEYGFKVVLQIFDNSSIDEFYIKNSTDIIANKRSAKEFRPYYNDDNYISIYLSQGDKAYGVFFYAYVTLVAKKSFLFDRCQVKGNGTIKDWYINTWASLVLINVHCYYNLAIPYNKEVDVEIGPLVIEKDVDFLQYTFDKNNTVRIEDTSMAVSKLNRFTLGSYLDGRNKHYLWEYICDGSFLSLGTYVRFTEITCQCPKPYIQCTHTQMTGITDFTGRYCGNLHCNSTIGLCNSSTTLMLLKIQDCYFWENGNIPERENYDVFKLYSNEEKVLEINYFNRLEQDFQLYLNPSNLYTLELTTYQSLIVKCLLISTQAQTVSPVNSEVTLTSANPFHFLDSGFSNSIIVKSDLQNDTFILYSSRKYGIPIYYNESFSRRYVDYYCFSDFFPYSCQVTTDKFVIHKSNSLYPILSIHSTNYRQNGCLFNSTFTTKLNFDVPITVVASSTHYCIATILIDSQTYSNDLVPEHYINRINGYFYYHISFIWTNAKSETVKVFAGTDCYLFEFNSQTAKKWTSIDLFSNAYTIKVPKQTSIYLRLKRRNVDFLPYAVIAEPYENAFITHIYDPNYYGLISTPFYGTSKRSPNDTVNTISYYFKNFSMKITTLYHKMSAGESVSFIYRNQPDIRVNKTGDTFIFDNNNITLQYSKQENSSQSNGAIFLLQIIKKTKEDSEFKVF